jgi:hypothetical protein
MSQYNTKPIIDNILNEVKGLLERFPYPLSSWGKSFVGILTVRPNIGFSEKIVMASDYNDASYDLRLSKEELEDKKKKISKYHIKRREQEYLPVSESYYQLLSELNEECDTYNHETGCETTPASCVKQITSVKSISRVDKLNLDQILAEHKSFIDQSSKGSLNINITNEKQTKTSKRDQITNSLEDNKATAGNTNQRTQNLVAEPVEEQLSDLTQLLDCVYKYRAAQINQLSTKKISIQKYRADFHKFNNKVKKEMFKQVENALSIISTDDERNEYENLPTKLKNYLEPLIEGLFMKILNSKEMTRTVADTIMTNFITINERMMNYFINSLCDLD